MILSALAAIALIRSADPRWQQFIAMINVSDDDVNQKAIDRGHLDRFVVTDAVAQLNIAIGRYKLPTVDDRIELS